MCVVTHPPAHAPGVCACESSRGSILAVVRCQRCHTHHSAGSLWPRAYLSARTVRCDRGESAHLHACIVASCSMWRACDAHRTHARRKDQPPGVDAQRVASLVDDDEGVPVTCDSTVSIVLQARCTVAVTAIAHTRPSAVADGPQVAGLQGIGVLAMGFGGIGAARVPHEGWGVGVGGGLASCPCRSLRSCSRVSQ